MVVRYDGIAVNGTATDIINRYMFSIKNPMVTKNWFDMMVQNKWLEQPPLAPTREEIAKEK